jgi:rifampicin phosphotransferase
MGQAPSINELLDRFSLVKVKDRNEIRELSGELRRLIEGIAIPEDIDEEIGRHLRKLGEEDAYAVQSSATSEDLPTVSFAGQQDID